jgi:hypothetical protein
MFQRTLPLLNRKSTHALGASPYTTVELPRWLAWAVVAVTIEDVEGSPTAMSITPRFEMWHSVTGGGEFERMVGTSFTPPYFPITAASNPFLLPDGDWKPFTTVDPPASGLSQAKTIRGGFPWRLRLDWSFTSGTSPAAAISAIVYAMEATDTTSMKPPPGL